MAKISLLLDQSLEVNNQNQLTVKRSSKTGNTLQVTEDGLYVPAPGGSSGGNGTGYADGVSPNGFLIGYRSPYGNSRIAHRANAPNTVHRIFTCTDEHGSDINIRQGANTGDYVLPGDFYRVRVGNSYDYYLVLSTTGGIDGSGGSAVDTSVKLATVPISEKLNGND